MLGAAGSQLLGPIPHQCLRLWILDIDGTRDVIAGTYFPETTEQERDDLDTLLNSIHMDVEADQSGDDDPVETSQVSATSSV